MFTWIDQIDDWIEQRSFRRIFKQNLLIAQSTEDRLRELGQLAAEQILDHSRELKRKIEMGAEHPALAMAEAFALASFSCQHFLGFRPNATQIVAAILLAEGKVIEMRAGEGKTAVAMLAAYWQYLHAVPTRIATTNDYLAERDQRWMGLAYGALGISPGVVISTTPRPERKAEYQKPVTYVSHQELGFDYLRDHLETNPANQVSGHFEFVIIDEADAILIDEARTSLIITEPGPEEVSQEATRELATLIEAVKKLTPHDDYTIDYRLRSVSLTDAGAEKLTGILGEDIFRDRKVEEIEELWFALYASVFFEEDRDYVVQDGKVVLISEFTGHAMPDRVLLEGLQRAVETKAGVKVSRDHTIVASITYRNFFSRFKKIAGMTGTAYAAREELYNLYQLEVFPLTAHKGQHRKDLPTTFFRAEKEKIDRIIWEAARAKSQNVPLLLVTRTIGQAKKLSDALAGESIQHQLLHAEVGALESKIIENAGAPGTVTVATNMAGRGADIIVDESLRLSYGLRVIGVEHNLSERIDEQLRGRSGRQGQFGETEFFASLEDELPQAYGDDAFWDRAEALDWKSNGLTDSKLENGVFQAQKTAVEVESDLRAELARFDNVVDGHRQAIYRLRQSLLESPAFSPMLEREIRQILTIEHTATLHLADLKKLIGLDTLAPSTRNIVENYLIRHHSLPLESSIDATTRKEYNLLKQEILGIMDQSWKRYLASVSWLQDWISLTAIGNRDPYAEFAETADRMFHDMRRDFAVTALRAILKRI